MIDNMKFQKNIGRVLLILKKEMGYLQKDMAKEIGVCRQTYGRMENGEHDFRVTEIQRICEAFLLDPGKLIKGEI